MVMVRPTDVSAVASLSLYAPIYRCTGLLVLWLWLWGVCVLVFDTYRISYVFVFQLNPRNRLTHFSLFNEASNITIVYLVNCLLLISHYEHALDAHVSSHIYPISLLAFFLLKLFTPSTFLSYWHTRATLLSTVASVVTAPFGSVTFRDTYVGDVLTFNGQSARRCGVLHCAAAITVRTGACNNLQITRHLSPTLRQLPAPLVPLPAVPTTLL